jgi:hypothetical protein
MKWPRSIAFQQYPRHKTIYLYNQQVTKVLGWPVGKSVNNPDKPFIRKSTIYLDNSGYQPAKCWLGLRILDMVVGSNRHRRLWPEQETFTQ